MSGDFDYDFNGNKYEGFVARPATDGDSALVLVAHAWGGLGDHEKEAATRLARLGYTGFAIDVYGKGKRGTTVEENQALMNPLASDRDELQARLKASLDAGRALGNIDQARSAIIGYCFGGMCAFDLARTGSDIRGAVSFHGLFGAPGNHADTKITAKVLALHGWSDPMATPEQMIEFGKEMDSKGANWQVHAYGDTFHSFTKKAANDRANGQEYSPDADRRSWRAMQNFLEEVFG